MPLAEAHRAHVVDRSDAMADDNAHGLTTHIFADRAEGVRIFLSGPRFVQSSSRVHQKSVNNN